MKRVQELWKDFVSNGLDWNQNRVLYFQHEMTVELNRFHETLNLVRQELLQMRHLNNQHTVRDNEMLQLNESAIKRLAVEGIDE